MVFHKGSRTVVQHQHYPCETSESRTLSHIGAFDVWAWPCVPSNKDAQQVNVISARQQHSHAQSQFKNEEPADDLVDAVALAQCQEVEVVQVRGNVRHTCREQKPSRVLTKEECEGICSGVTGKPSGD